MSDWTLRFTWCHDGSFAPVEDNILCAVTLKPTDDGEFVYYLYIPKSDGTLAYANVIVLSEWDDATDKLSEVADEIIRRLDEDEDVIEFMQDFVNHFGLLHAALAKLTRPSNSSKL